MGSLQLWVRGAGSGSAQEGGTAQDGSRCGSLPWWAVDAQSVATVLRALGHALAAEAEAAAEAARASTQANATGRLGAVKDAALTAPYEPIAQPAVQVALHDGASNFDPVVGPAHGH